MNVSLTRDLKIAQCTWECLNNYEIQVRPLQLCVSCLGAESADACEEEDACDAGGTRGDAVCAEAEFSLQREKDGHTGRGAAFAPRGGPEDAKGCDCVSQFFCLLLVDPLHASVTKRGDRETLSQADVDEKKKHYIDILYNFHLTRSVEIMSPAVLISRQTILSPFEQKLQKQIQEKSTQKAQAARRVFYEKEKLKRTIQEKKERQKQETGME